MTNKKVAELDAEFIKYKAEAKASMDALEKNIDDGIEKLEASIKAMKEESDVKLDAKFEELRQLILGTPPSQSTHVDHDPQITKVAAKTAPPKYWDVEKFHKLIIVAIKEEKNQEEEGQGNGEIDGQGGQVGGRGNEVNDGVDGVPDFSIIIAQQLQNLLLTVLAQVGNQGSNQGNGRNQNGDAVNDNIQGDVRNVIANNDHRGCTYKKFLACNPKEYDGKGDAIVYTRWIEKMESVQDMSGCEVNQKVKYIAGSLVGKALTW
ncbi:hypothetical protein Tco_0231550 [Tanacetum coccineum]